MGKSKASLVLLGILTASTVLSACGNNNNDAANEPAKSTTSNADAGNKGNKGNNENSPATSTDSKETNNEAPKAADPFGKYADPVTVTEVLGYNPPEDPKTPAGLTPDKNAYLKDLKDQMNIDVKYLWTVPTDQFEQKFSIAIASGDLPDVMDLDPRNFEKFKNQGVLADLTDAYAQYASPALKKFMESDGGAAMKSVSQDGKLYALPGFEEPFLSTQLLWIRQDWLKNLGLEAPKSIDELEKVAEAFTKNDPDKNGKNDTFGITLPKTVVGWAFDARGFFNGFNSYMGGWTKGADGKLAAGEIQPETKAALARLQSWYSKGLLDKEFGLKDESKVSEDIIGSKVGIAYGEWWVANWPLNLNKDKDKNADWIALQIPSIDGQPGKSLVPTVRMGHIVVANKKFKNPEAVVKMANFYIEMNTKKYYETNKPENGYVYNWFVPRIFNPTDIENIYTNVNNALGKKLTEIEDQETPYYTNSQQVLDAANKYLAGDKSGSVWGLYNSRVDENGGWGLTRQIRDNKQFVFNEYYGPATETQIDKGAQLDKLVNETFVKIIMGSAKIDEFDKFVSSWKALGGDDITKEVNAWYDKNK
ncbi:extracellular solute-binding protein [Paenibacillus rhizovicinus]|uniref:Extracellular solute-binding protein n=1 Tax=Paenibacillus rhizovicinus TaxID=2704463 RepID=A0A6C0P0A1_9BACL|nr:extracellular solute-binding protein [Paenibacillus rhizovicinus]QHW31898.1 extracellular solute-binding protein [Paenibacillus rhizovicinus]